MAENLIKWIAPVRERRVEYEKRPGRVLEMIEEGSKRARVEAKKTMERVREAVFGWEKKREGRARGGIKARVSHSGSFRVRIRLRGGRRIGG